MEQRREGGVNQVRKRHYDKLTMNKKKRSRVGYSHSHNKHHNSRASLVLYFLNVFSVFLSSGYFLSCSVHDIMIIFNGHHK